MANYNINVSTHYDSSRVRVRVTSAELTNLRSCLLRSASRYIASKVSVIAIV